MSTNDETTSHRTRTNRRAAAHEAIEEANDVEAMTTSDARLDGHLVHGFAPSHRDRDSIDLMTPSERATFRNAQHTTQPNRGEA